MPRVLIVAALAVACGADKAEDASSVSLEGYLSGYPEQYCALQAECYPERYRDLFDNDDAACIETTIGPVERKVSADDCDFNGARAQECLDYISVLDCAAWAAGEDDVCAVSVICGAD
jgi:hypothetical protein